MIEKHPIPNYAMLIGELIGWLEWFQQYCKDPVAIQRIKKRADDLRQITLADFDPQKIKEDLEWLKKHERNVNHLPEPMNHGEEIKHPTITDAENILMKLSQEKLAEDDRKRKERLEKKRKNEKLK